MQSAWAPTPAMRGGISVVSKTSSQQPAAPPAQRAHAPPALPFTAPCPTLLGTGRLPLFPSPAPPQHAPRRPRPQGAGRAAGGRALPSGVGGPSGGRHAVGRRPAARPRSGGAAAPHGALQPGQPAGAVRHAGGLGLLRGRALWRRLRGACAATAAALLRARWPSAICPPSTATRAVLRCAGGVQAHCQGGQRVSMAGMCRYWRGGTRDTQRAWRARCPCSHTCSLSNRPAARCPATHCSFTPPCSFEYLPERPDADGFMRQKWGWRSTTPGAPGACVALAGHGSGASGSGPATLVHAHWAVLSIRFGPLLLDRSLLAAPSSYLFLWWDLLPWQVTGPSLKWTPRPTTAPQRRTPTSGKCLGC